MAEQLRSVVRPTDAVARIGGDEFLIACPGTTSVEEAITLATRITDLQLGADSARHPLRFTASVGIALAGPQETRQTLISRADAAMYHAKATGSGYTLAP